MSPPLAYSVCVTTLHRLASVLSEAQPDSTTKSLYLHFADEEGDPYAVALAGRLNAYVAGRDSDFIVLNAEGYQGYIPLDEMVWTLSTSLGGGLSQDTEGSVYSSNVSIAGDSKAPSLSGFGDDEDGFQTVKKGKGKKRRQAQAGQTQTAGRGILPPDALTVINPDSETSTGTEAQLALSFTVYSPATLATHLGIPVSVLPLLGALLGNDFTGAPVSDDSAPPPATTAEIRSKGRANLQRLFFERQLTLAQRITRVSSTLSGILAAAFDGSGSGKRRGKRAIGSVMELIDAAVTALLIRPLDTFATGEKEAIVERIVEATLQYAVPRVEVEEGMEEGEEEVGGLRWVSGACPLHLQDACPLLGTLSGLVRERDAAMPLREEQGGEPEEVDPDDPLELAREEYLDAYRRGMLDPHLLDTMQTGTMWPRMFLEDPDKETVLKTIARPIRLWTYAILDAGVGLPRAPVPEEIDEDDEDRESDDDELVDVVEEDSDSEPIPNAFARLRGALKQLNGSEEEDDDEDAAQDSPVRLPTANGQGQQATPSKHVTEYVRRGTRLAPEEINVTSLEKLLHESALEPPTDPLTKARLPPQIWSYKLRRTLMLHALASNSVTVSSLPDDRLLGVVALRWVVRTMHQRSLDNPGVKERFLERWTQAEARAVLASFSQPSPDDSPAPGDKTESISPTERHIQLVAQITSALDGIEQLSQVLLLSSTILSPARHFSGARCHALLSERATPSAGEPAKELWEACVEGLEDAYALPPQKRAKRAVKSAVAPPVPAGRSTGRGGRNTKAGLFNLLADVEA
ncbi:hypothetical protein GSI_05687 [Ganoderma sinense ZZ0214-1]|uniref:Asteroid domain-containing protein n=1 Tax=Ganoderma sinense ZZ0214-1 TaxID=1077348 RepID=A0A2G8SB54_9APHY|nr:hypothetical protein GSI_05687 [Ganoderma sinense ZZ0214-1]